MVRIQKFEIFLITDLTLEKFDFLTRFQNLTEFVKFEVLQFVEGLKKTLVSEIGSDSLGFVLEKD